MTYSVLPCDLCARLSFEPSREKLGRLGITSITLPNPTRADVLRQLDLLRAGLRIAVTTIRKMKHNQKVDADAVLAGWP
jgi:hypothetical protein